MDEGSGAWSAYPPSGSAQVVALHSAGVLRVEWQAGAEHAFGSDWPVFSMEVLTGIYCAATRMTPQGTPAGSYFPEHCITVDAALRHLTRAAACACFDERDEGTLDAGKFADLVVLSQNIVEEPAERVQGARVLRTAMGGRDTHRAGDTLDAFP